MTREYLETALISEEEKEILEIIDSVCPGVFLVNRKRLELTQKIQDYVDKKVYETVSKRQHKKAIY